MDTPTRLLRLLSLFSTRPSWSAVELAGETETTERTVRRDVSRLRELGYPIDATTGPYGGYTLGRGTRMPPLVLDDDEAVAVAVALRVGAGGATGTESAALNALATLDQVLPARLRERVSALAAVSVGLHNPGRPPVDVDALMTVALACRGTERVRFTYTDANGRTTTRLVEPYGLVYTDRWWYVVAYDTMRAGWRSFRVDRTREVSLSSERFTPVKDAPDPVTFVSEGLAVGGYEIQARVRLQLPLDAARRAVPPTTAVLEAGDDGTTIARIGGEADWIARFLAGLECAFEVLEPDDVRRELRALGRRLVRLGS